MLCLKSTSPKATKSGGQSDWCGLMCGCLGLSSEKDLRIKKLLTDISTNILGLPIRRKVI